MGVVGKMGELVSAMTRFSSKQEKEKAHHNVDDELFPQVKEAKTLSSPTPPNNANTQRKQGTAFPQHLALTKS
jgi:hypothetical protein